MITRHLIGGFDVSDIRWQDLEEVTLRVGIFGADLSVRAGKAADLASQGATGSRRLDFPGLVNPRPRRCIASARRRISPGAKSAASASSRSCVPAQVASRSVRHRARWRSRGTSDAVRRLQDAKQMLDARLITDAEYEAIKAKIVSS